MSKYCKFIGIFERHYSIMNFKVYALIADTAITVMAHAFVAPKAQWMDQYGKPRDFLPFFFYGQRNIDRTIFKGQWRHDKHGIIHDLNGMRYFRIFRKSCI